MNAVHGFVLFPEMPENFSAAAFEPLLSVMQSFIPCERQEHDRIFRIQLRPLEL
jgi:hypothetical protein